LNLLELLEHERLRARQRLTDVDAEIEAIDSVTAGANADDEHDPEGSTIAFERSRAAALRAQARADLAEIDAALARLRDDTIGTCEICGGAIPPERLEARPTARTCVSCATTAR
jgi:RNA polymerase-binding transcription factor DksA